MECQEEIYETEQLSKNAESELLDANIILYETLENLIKNKKEFEEYNKLLEEKIRDLELNQSLNNWILDNINDAVEIFDNDLTLVYQNEISQDELSSAIGKNFHQIYQQSNQEDNERIINEMMTTRKSISETFKNKDKVHTIKAIPLKYGDGDNRFVIIRRITSEDDNNNTEETKFNNFE